MSPRSLTSAPTGAYCCSSARSVNSRSGNLFFPGAFSAARGEMPSSTRGRENAAHGRTVDAEKFLFSLIQLPLAIQRGKKVRKFPDGLGGAQEEKSARIQRVVKQRNDLPLQFSAHIDQKVAATDQIEFGKGRVFNQVLLGKDQQVADAFVDAVEDAVWLLDEKPGQPFRGNVGGDAGGIEAGDGPYQ